MKFSKKEIIKIIGLFLALVFSIVAVVLFAAPFLVIKKADVTVASGYDIAFDFSLDQVFYLFAPWLLIVLTILFIVLEFVFYFLKKKKIIKLKNWSKPTKFNIWINIICEVAIMTLTGVLIFTFIPVFKFSESIYELGSGAIGSGILSILSGVAIAFTRAVDLFIK